MIGEPLKEGGKLRKWAIKEHMCPHTRDHVVRGCVKELPVVRRRRTQGIFRRESELACNIVIIIFVIMICTEIPCMIIALYCVVVFVL